MKNYSTELKINHVEYQFPWDTNEMALSVSLHTHSHLIDILLGCGVLKDRMQSCVWECIWR